MITTKQKLINRIYNNQLKTSRKRGHRKPEYNATELYEWAMSQLLFHELYSEYLNSGFKKMLAPSVDRKNDDIHYCMNNIQLMTWDNNQTKAHVSARKRVCCYTVTGKFIEEFESIKLASKKTHIASSNITNCAKGNNKTAGYMLWRYVND